MEEELGGCWGSTSMSWFWGHLCYRAISPLYKASRDGKGRLGLYDRKGQTTVLSPVQSFPAARVQSHHGAYVVLDGHE